MNLSDNIFRYDMDYYLLIKNVYVKITLNITLSPLSKYRNTLTFVPYFFMVLNLRLIEDWLSG